MSGAKRTALSAKNEKPNSNHVDNDQLFRDLIEFVLLNCALFTEEEFHGNVKWVPKQLAAHALSWTSSRRD